MRGGLKVPGQVAKGRRGAGSWLSRALLLAGGRFCYCNNSSPDARTRRNAGCTGMKRTALLLDPLVGRTRQGHSVSQARMGPGFSEDPEESEHWMQACLVLPFVPVLKKPQDSTVPLSSASGTWMVHKRLEYSHSLQILSQPWHNSFRVTSGVFNTWTCEYPWLTLFLCEEEWPRAPPSASDEFPLTTKNAMECSYQKCQ